jgi:hypothetical protein
MRGGRRENKESRGNVESERGEEKTNREDRGRK